MKALYRLPVFSFTIDVRVTFDISGIIGKLTGKYPTIVQPYILDYAPERLPISNSISAIEKSIPLELNSLISTYVAVYIVGKVVCYFTYDRKNKSVKQYQTSVLYQDSERKQFVRKSVDLFICIAGQHVLILIASPLVKKHIQGVLIQNTCSLVISVVAFTSSQLVKKNIDQFLSYFLPVLVKELQRIFTEMVPISRQIQDLLPSYLVSKSDDNKRKENDKSYNEEREKEKEKGLCFKFYLYSHPAKLDIGDLFFVSRVDASPKLQLGRIGQIVRIEGLKLTISFPKNPSFFPHFCPDYDHTPFKNCSDYFFPFSTYKAIKGLKPNADKAMRTLFSAS